ncbi:FAD-dependent oxidoreductase [Lysinibacillus agricola]|uniref:FAD-dependent oxidoreductase n=1 Tax=Lysinibacillus agricola TaxID=2590012 RepID=UPI003C19465F
MEIIGGFKVSKFVRPNQFSEQLCCNFIEDGSIVVDEAGHTSQENVYAAGGTVKLDQSSLIVAVAEGYKTAIVGSNHN